MTLRMVGILLWYQKILKIFLPDRKRALQNRARVAIGVRNPGPKMLKSARDAHEAGYAHVILVGNKKEIEQVGTDLEIIGTNDPERTLGDLLKSRYIDAAVRGTAGASQTLAHLKDILNQQNLHRIALLETSEGEPFFLAPVGIDEGNELADKIEFIKLGVEYIRRFEIEPVVGILFRRQTRRPRSQFTRRPDACRRRLYCQQDKRAGN
ncbi:MAG: hypothetical protein R2741_00465 [Methanolobus sp.]